MKTIRRNTRIQQKMAAIFIIIITIVLGGYAVFDYLTSKSRLDNELEHLAEITKDRLVVHLISPLYNMDDAAVEKSLDVEMKEKHIYAIIVRGKDKKNFLYGKKRDDQWNIIDVKNNISETEKYKVSISIIKSQEIVKNDYPLGIIDVYFTSKFIHQELKESMINIAVTVIIINVVLFVSLFFTTNKFLVSPVRCVIENMSKSAEQIASSSLQLADSSQSLTQRSSVQAAYLNDTFSSLEKISAHAGQNVTNAKQADDFIKDLKQSIDTVNVSMSVLTISMDEIFKVSNETSGIVKLINEIAFQTNLLALNAAIESARAGEAGVGFSVVAGEVRNLAMKVGEAAGKISELIKDIIQKVKNGSELVSKTNETFIQMAERSGVTTELMSKISTDSNEQADNIERLSKGFGETEKATQENVTAAEEYASISEEMSNQAEQLNMFVEELVALVRN